jgi:hypothetical protein
MEFDKAFEAKLNINLSTIFNEGLDVNSIAETKNLSMVQVKVTLSDIFENRCLILIVWLHKTGIKRFYASIERMLRNHYRSYVPEPLE